MSIFVLSSTVNSQIFNDATVNYVMSVGGMEYAFVTSTQTNEIYQTSPFANGELLVNQEVRLMFDDVNDTSPKVLARTLTSQLYAQLVNSGNIPPPPMDNMPVFDQSTGVLFFTSKEAGSDYFESFCSYMYDNEDDDSINTLKLDYFESYYPGYLSHRKELLIDLNMNEGDYSLEEINNAQNRTFVHHEVLKTFLNSSRMVGFGDSIACKLTPEIEVAFEKTDLATLNYIETLLDLTDDEIIIKGFIGNPKLIMTASTASILNTKGEFIEPNGTWKIETGFAVQNDVCNSLKQKLIITLTEYTWNTTYNEWDNAGKWNDNHTVTTNTDPFVLNVDWGDGTSQQISGWVVGTSLTHTYPSQGTYQITTYLDIPEIPTVNGLLIDPDPIEDGQGFSDDIPAITGNILSCIRADQIQAGGQVIQGEYMIMTSVWTGRFWSNKWVGSSTESWKKKNNGNWKKKKLNIRTDVAGTFRKTTDCTFQSSQSGYKQNYNDKKVYKFIYERTGGYWHSYWTNLEQVSSHYLYPPNGGVGSELEFHAVIEFCP